MFIARQAIRPSARIVSMTPRAIAGQLGTVRCFAIGDELSKKEHVEEMRYIHEQEKKFYDRKRSEKKEAEHAQELAVFEEVVAPAMVECQELLKKSGDTVSDQGLELLAKWKLGMNKK